MEPKKLAGLLKRIYEEFDVSKFSDRLKVQKFVYILQNRGINLGYLFNFYLYGPYSTDLARTAFNIEDYESIRKARFISTDKEKKFKEILSKLKNHKDDTRWLEGASSILLLKDLNYSKDTIYKQLAIKKVPFEKEDVDRIWQELESWRWIE